MIWRAEVGSVSDEAALSHLRRKDYLLLRVLTLCALAWAVLSSSTRNAA